jgi:pimeloyl-ACP methyl ester carboxylesterase
MIETKSWFGDVRVVRLARAEPLAAEALVMFHGFPGQPPADQVEKYKNVPRMRVEASKALVAAREIDAYLPGYEGLGESRGKFGFHRSAARSVEFAQDLSNRYAKVHVAGHSWGAFVAVNVHDALGVKAGRLALLAGLLDLGAEITPRSFLPEYIREYPEIMGTDAGALARWIEDLDETRRDFNPMEKALPLPEDRLLILHGTPDAAVPVALSRRFHAKFGGRLVEVADDHVFSKDMPRAIKEIADFFAA